MNRAVILLACLFICVPGLVFAQAPNLTSVAPTSGTPLGGDTVTLTGTDFTAGDSVDFGGVIVPPTFVTSTALTVTTPAHAPGLVDITVTNGNGSSTLTNAFTYLNPPSLTSLSLTMGTPLGGDTVTLNGTDFTAGDTVTFDGIVVPATFTTSTALTVTTPAHASGPVDVAVSNSNGSSTLVGGFTYLDGPNIITLTPASGTTAGGTTSTLAGSGFNGTETVTYDGIPAASVTFDSPITLIVVSPPHAAGPVHVVVTNSNGTDTQINGFTYVSPAPTVASLSPTNGPPAGGTSVTVTGTNFTGSDTVTFDGLAAASVTFDSATQLTVTTPAHAPGAVDVTVTNTNGSDTLTGGFTYDAPPTITSVAPGTGAIAGGDSVVITGTGFVGSETVTFDGLAAGVTFDSATQLTVTTPAHAVGAVDVSVSNLNGSDTLVGGFTYVGPPVLTSLAPMVGTTAGGTTVTLTGTDFTAADSVTFDGVAAAVTFLSSTSLSVVTPAHAAGAVDVTVSNANGSDTLVGGYTYVVPPMLLVVNPSNGSSAGGQTVTLLGSGFTADMVASFDGIPAATSFISPTSALATTPAHAPGVVDVEVNSVNGSSLLSNGFTYNAPPTISSVAPADGPPSGGTSVTITGTGFVAGSTVRFDGTLATITSLTATSIDCTTPGHAAGTVDVTVMNSNGTATASNAFTYLSPPTVTSVSPTSGPTAGGTTVTISGANFDGSETVTFGGIAAASVTPVGPTSMTAVTPANSAGSVDVVVSNANGSGTLAGGFTYEAPPTITLVSPATGSTLGGDSIAITGTGFNGTESVTFGAVAAASVTFNSATSLTAVTPAGSSGSVNVTVTNSNGSDTLIGGFTYGLPTPTITSVTPSTGGTAGGTVVTITGTNYTGSDSVMFDGISASVTFLSNTSLSAVTPAHAAGPVSVTVTNANGSDTLVGGFTYLAPPAIASISPTSGSPLGGTPVTISGTGFAAGSTVTIGGAACTAIVVVNDGQITCSTPPGSGASNVVVTNANGSDTLAGGFTYNQQPSITSLTPNSGNAAGGDMVTINGQGFTPSSNVFFGGAAAPSVVFLDSLTLTVATPPGSAGAVDVTVSTENGSAMLVDGFTYLSNNIMKVVDATATPGSQATITVELTVEEDIKGYTTSMVFDPMIFTLTAIDMVGTDTSLLVGAVNTQGGVEFFDETIDNAMGFGIGAAVFDLSPPFLSQSLPAGGPYTIMRYRFDTPNDPLLIGSVHNFDLVDGMGSPPVNNAVSYQNDIGQTLTLNPQTMSGTLTFVDTQIFKRADANGDGLPNIADAIFMITFLFNAGAAPTCFAAADANGDGLLDISDIITVIQWQFGGGSQPPAPFPDCGPDPGTPLDCGQYTNC